MTEKTATAVTLGSASQYWWLILIQGALSVFIGWMLLARPIGTIDVLVSVLGLFWLVMGFVDVIKAIMSALGGAKKWAWQLVGGVVGVIAGMVVLNNQTLSMVLLPGIAMYFVAFSSIINGIISMSIGRDMSGSGSFEWSWGTFFLGLLYLILGMALLGMPTLVAIKTVVFAFGLITVGSGIGLIVLSFMIKNAGEKKAE